MSELSEPSYHRLKELELFVSGPIPKISHNNLKHKYTNIWYMLATTYQDQTSDDAVNTSAKEQNRITWNRFMCQKLSEKEKYDIKDKFNLPDDDFLQFSKEDQEKLEINLRKCSAKSPLKQFEDWKNKPSAETPIISFEDINFESRILFDGFIFSGAAIFSRSFFKNETSFSKSIFLNRVEFILTDFQTPVSFDESYFKGTADFSFSRFKKSASFRKTNFNKTTLFKGCIFEGPSLFSDADFQDSTSFDQSNFKNKAPHFFNSNLYEDTIISTEDGLWPKASFEESKNQERVYARLRRYMNDIKKPDEEMFFHKLEMRAKSMSQNCMSSFMINTYDCISVFGKSIIRPLVILAIIILLGWHFISTCGCYDSSKFNPKIDGLLWSMSNSIPLVKFSSVIEVSKLTGFLKLFSVLQSIVSAILLFLVILAIRNKFRLK